MKKCLVLLSLPVLLTPAFAGGPLLVGGPNFGKVGQPFVWNPAKMPIQYRVDSGPLTVNSSGATLVDNASALASLRGAFNAWHNVPTASISYNYAGPILGSNGQPAGPITTMAQLNDVMGTCNQGTQSPVIFNNLMFNALGLNELVGAAGICSVDTTNTSASFIKSAVMFINGADQDPQSGIFLSTSVQFNAALAHEVGHFSGLDHSQSNRLSGPISDFDQGGCLPDLVAGLPVMTGNFGCHNLLSDAAGFPLIQGDDAAWISKLYPNTQTPAAYGTISGTIFFSDRKSQRQGVVVIARKVDDPATPENESLRNAFSAISGYLFTANPGQQLTGDNTNGDPSGSRDPRFIGYYEIPVPPGTYTVEIDSIRPNFIVGPRINQVDVNGPNEFWNKNESAFDYPLEQDTITVVAGETVADINIIENGPTPTFDSLEDSGRLRVPRLGFTLEPEESKAL
jgi:hypothetical protein